MPHPATATSPVTTDIFVVRQPLFDRRLVVRGYELLFSSQPEDAFEPHEDDDASERVLGDSIVAPAFDPLTGGRPAWIHATPDLLLSGLVENVPAEGVILVLDRAARPDTQVLGACSSLKEAGYTFALDGRGRRDVADAWLDVVSLVGIDLLDTEPDEVEQLVERLLPRGVRLLAQGVETRWLFETALDRGFDLFQGWFLHEAPPASGKVPGFKLNYLRFFKEINRSELDLDALEQIIRHEPTISLRLLAYLNSAAFAWRREVTSIKQALLLLGERPLKRWASMLAVTGLVDDHPAEVAISCLVRARLCELLARPADLEDRTLDLFFAGMLSVVGPLVGKSMESLLDDMSASPGLRSALLGGTTSVAMVLDLVRAYDKARWDDVSRLAQGLGLDPDRLGADYRLAVTWAEDAFTP